MYRLLYVLSKYFFIISFIWLLIIQIVLKLSLLWLWGSGSKKQHKMEKLKFKYLKIVLKYSTVPDKFIWWIIADKDRIFMILGGLKKIKKGLTHSEIYQK